MKLLKSFAAITEKYKGGRTKKTNPMTDDEAGSYEGYDDHVHCDGTEAKLTINGEDYFRWVFYPEKPATNEDLPTHIQKNLGSKKRKPFHFYDDMEQERYEWFCGGWIQFYDDILRPEELGGKEHKLFFCWVTKDVPGVAIYINDENVQKPTYNIKLEYDTAKRQLLYTAPPVTDPPGVPPPPPPSKT
jgi:hypothetical protein